MRIDRFYTEAGKDVFSGLSFRTVTADNGRDYLVPAGWSDAAAGLASLLFYPHPIPENLSPVTDSAVPDFLRPSANAGGGSLKFETDIRDVIHRVAGGFAYQAAKAGLFSDAEQARAFYDEWRYILLHQIAAPEIALYAAAGIEWAYGLPCEKFRPAERVASLEAATADISTGLSPGAIFVGLEEKKTDVLKRLRHVASLALIESGGGALRVTMPVEQKDSADFIRSRHNAETARAAEDVGRRMIRAAAHHVMDACDRDRLAGFDPDFNPALKQAVDDARKSGLDDAVIAMAIDCARMGHEYFPLPEAEETGFPFTPVLSIPDSFIETALTGHGFALVEEGAVHHHADAANMMEILAESLWASGAPEIFFRDSAVGAEDNIAQGAGGGLLFMPDTAAPAGTVNLEKFSGAVLDTARLAHVVRLLAIALESSFAIAGVTEKTLAYRPLVISAAGLAPFLMEKALAYDSEAGRTTAALLTAFVTGAAHLASAEMADRIGAFDGYADMSREYLKNVKDKIAALSGSAPAMKGVMRRPPLLKPALCPDASLPAAVREVWEKSYALGRMQGFRHAHLTAFASPPALQGLLDARTRDIMPMTAAVTFDGADIYSRRIDAAVPAALQRLGYETRQIDDMCLYAAGHGTLFGAPAINHDTLKFSKEELARVEALVKSVRHVRYAFFGRQLEEMGFSESDIESANLYACGALTLEGAPHLKPEHLAVFDCILPPSEDSVRAVTPEAQIRMQAAVEPFLSGAAVHTVALGRFAAIDDIRAHILKAWETGVKHLRLYREGSSLLLAPAQALPAIEEKPQAKKKKARAI